MRMNKKIVLLLLIAFTVLSIPSVFYAKHMYRKTTKIKYHPELILLDGQPVYVRCTTSTAVIYRLEGPPPWKGGNCLTLFLDDPENINKNIEAYKDFKTRSVINMTTQNFGNFFINPDFPWLQLETFGESYCIVTDPRIPRQWFRQQPCFCNSYKKEYVMSKYAKFFSIQNDSPTIPTQTTP